MADTTVLVALGSAATSGTATAEKVAQLTALLEAKGHRVMQADTAVDAVSAVASHPDLAAALVSWELTSGALEMSEPTQPAETVLRVLMDRFSPKFPVFLITRDTYRDDLPLWVSEVVNGWIWLLEDTADFVAGRVDCAARAYLENILPPFFRALRHFEDAHNYSWHTPAHAGGVALLKSPVGRAFYDYYGERLFRTDLSCSVGELGSLFEHTGPIGDAEHHAATVFGADRTYFVLNGTSTGDRIVVHASVAAGQTVLMDRNCHKALNHGIILSGARPTYLLPTRNGYGLTGPIPPDRLRPESIREQVNRNPLTRGVTDLATDYAGITNSTYDGLCYDVVQVATLLGRSIRILHLDEAWFAYARFNPLYQRRYGMAIDSGTVPDDTRPTVFATQSTHKLLAALSQSAMIHVKESPERAPFDPHRFNETVMMHTTTSPLYPMIASLDIAAGMMRAPGGQWLTTEAITEAVRFRQSMVRLRRRICASGDRPAWFFGVWQPPEVIDPKTSRPVPFDEAPVELLQREPGCWTLAPNAEWHGFEGLERDYCLLDPIKVTITCPGIDAKGTVNTEFGIPARIVTTYLATRGIIVEKTDAYTFLVLFSMGITKGKWGTLLDALTDFKSAHDNNAALVDVLPALVHAHPEYSTLTLPQLCARMHGQLTGSRFMDLLNEAFTNLPEQVLSPSEAYQRLVRGGTQVVRLDDLKEDDVVVTQVVTCPPGIPVLMPGEKVGPVDGSLLPYLKALEEFDRCFPGFESETHGIHRDDKGAYQVTCLVDRP